MRAEQPNLTTPASCVECLRVIEQGERERERGDNYKIIVYLVIFDTHIWHISSS